MHEVVRHRERELAAQRSGVGVGGVRRADRLARGRDRALALEDERERRAGGDEVDELAEERLLAVLGVVRLPELAESRRTSRAARSFSAAPLEPRRRSRRRGSRSTASGLARIRVRSTAMRPRSLPGAASVRLRVAARMRREQPAPPDDRRLAVRADLPGRLERPAARRARRRSFVVQTGQTRKSCSTSALQTLHRISGPPSRLSIALISRSRSRTSSRYSGGRKSM